MQFKARIGFVKGNLIQVLVSCFKYDNQHDKVLTNELHLTFIAPNVNEVQKVFPKTYEEALIYLSSERRMKAMLQ